MRRFSTSTRIVDFVLRIGPKLQNDQGIAWRARRLQGGNVGQMRDELESSLIYKVFIPNVLI